MSGLDTAHNAPSTANTPKLTHQICRVEGCRNQDLRRGSAVDDDDMVTER
jgi:hypothetical protein